MKKFFAGLCAISLMLSMTACGTKTNDTEKGTETTTSVSADTETSESVSETGEDTVSESATGEDTVTDGDSAESETVAEGETVTEPVEEEVTEALDEEVVDVVDEEVTEPVEGEEVVTESSESVVEFSEQHNVIKQQIEAVIANVEHPTMEEVTDTAILKEFFLIDVENTAIQEVVVYQCPMSASMSEIIVIQSEDVDAAKEILEARKQKAIDQDAWYPEDKENAENSIVDTCGNFAYFVINSTSDEDAELLNTLLTENATVSE